MGVERPDRSASSQMVLEQLLQVLDPPVGALHALRKVGSPCPMACHRRAMPWTSDGPLVGQAGAVGVDGRSPFVGRDAGAGGRSTGRWPVRGAGISALGHDHRRRRDGQDPPRRGGADPGRRIHGGLGCGLAGGGRTPALAVAGRARAARRERRRRAPRPARGDDRAGAVRPVPRREPARRRATEPLAIVLDDAHHVDVAALAPRPVRRAHAAHGARPRRRGGATRRRPDRSDARGSRRRRHPHRPRRARPRRGRCPRRVGRRRAASIASGRPFTP